jgi:membrane protein YqaA with SNARE-associated domain
MFEFDNSLWGLFLSGLLASTLLPGGSELVFGYLLLDHVYPLSTLVLVVTLGNTLGGMTSWGLGRLLAWRYDYSHIHKPAVARALDTMHRYGAVALLFSWLPIIGDPLCVAAGWLRIHGGLALLLIAVGKALRYWVLALLLEGGYSAWQAML